MKNSNKNSNKSNTNTNTNESNKTRAELLEELQRINISIALLYTIIIALLLDLITAHNDRSKILDNLNETNFADYSSRLDNYSTIARRLGVFVSIINVLLSLKDLNSILASEPVDEKALDTVKQQLLSSIFLYLSAKISEGLLGFGGIEI